MDGLFPARVFSIASAVAVALVTLTTQPAFTAVADPDMTGYDSIVNDLNREADRSASRARISTGNSDALDSIMFHAGFGLGMTMQSLNLDDGSQAFIGSRGIELVGGIDLFSPNWLAEGTIRNFGEGDDYLTRVSLKEFELKVVYHDRLSRRLGWRAGGGLSARYLTVRRATRRTNGEVEWSVYDYTTPSSVLSGGMDFFLGERTSIGLELSTRNSMISDTIDQTSYDATIRIGLQL